MFLLLEFKGELGKAMRADDVARMVFWVQKLGNLHVSPETILEFQLGKIASLLCAHRIGGVKQVGEEFLEHLMQLLLQGAFLENGGGKLNP